MLRCSRPRNEVLRLQLCSILVSRTRSCWSLTGCSWLCAFLPGWCCAVVAARTHTLLTLLLPAACCVLIPAVCSPLCSSRECQQKAWKTGHKQECKKLKLLRKAEARRGFADGSSGVSSSGAEGSLGVKERPEESNSTPPVPKQVRGTPIEGAVGCWPSGGALHCYVLPEPRTACIAGQTCTLSDADPNHCYQVLFPPARYLELAAAPPQRKAPLGLQNVGNSCYANSLLQSLLATPTLAAFLASGTRRLIRVQAAAVQRWWCWAVVELRSVQTGRQAAAASHLCRPQPITASEPACSPACLPACPSRLLLPPRRRAWPRLPQAIRL